MGADFHAIRRDAAIEQGAAQGFGATLRQVDVHLRAADVVGIAFDEDATPRVLAQNGGDMVDGALRARCQRRAAAGEEHILQGDDEAAVGLLCLQHRQLAFKHSCPRHLLNRLRPGDGDIALRGLGRRFGSFGALAIGFGHDAFAFGTGVLDLILGLPLGAEVGGDLRLLHREVGEVARLRFVSVLSPGCLRARQRLVGFFQLERRLDGHRRVAACLDKCGAGFGQVGVWRRQAATGGKRGHGDGED